MLFAKGSLKWRVAANLRYLYVTCPVTRVSDLTRVSDTCPTRMSKKKVTCPCNTAVRQHRV